MPARHRDLRSARPVRTPGRAFSLLELIVILAIAGIMAAVAAPAMSTMTRTRRAAAASRLQHDLLYARQHAVATGTRTWVTFDAAAETYTLLAENPAAPGRAGAAPLMDAAGEPMTVDLSSEEYRAAIATVTLDSGSEVGFDWLGAPLNSSEDPLTSGGVVRLIGGYHVHISAVTGQITLTAP